MICKHIALLVPDLRAAESYYCNLFSMKLLFREATLGESWGTLPPDTDWDDAERAQVAIEMVALERGDFVLALFQGEPDPETVVEICLGLRHDEIDAVMDDLPEDVDIVDVDGLPKLRDRFGYHWTLETPETGFVSYGERLGRWLEI
jgi:catechol 2,3-dioxygenase-like lactoylglutathione lyase family enzyme